jgi:hypothetical protein
MSSHSEVMHCYETIRYLAEQMLASASSAQWGELPVQETQYSECVARLQFIEPHNELSQEQIARKYYLLTRINAMHAQIHAMVMPQLVELGAALKSLEQQQSLQKLYGQSGEAWL